MAWDAILWIIMFFMIMALIGLILYQYICLSDLEADYLNPYESSSRINAVVLPEFVLHGVFCTLFLVTGHWFMFLLTIPIACYNTMLFMKREHLIDVTEVFRFLSTEKKYRIMKFAFYIPIFFVVMIRLVIAGTFSNMLSVFLSQNEDIDIRSSYLEF